MSAVALAGIELKPMPEANKEDKLLFAFDNVKGEQSYRLAAEILFLLRNDGAFSNRLPSHRQWADRARTAFERAGYSLDADGYERWGYASMTPEDFRKSSERGRARVDGLMEKGLGSVAMPAKPVRTTAAEHLSGEGAVPRSYSPGDIIMEHSPDVVQPALGKQDIFLVHGHDLAARNEVNLFIRDTTGIAPVILMDQANEGLTVIEKFEQYTANTGYAVVLMTDDDLGNSKSAGEAGVLNPRPRQNVVFEFGYFVGAIRRKRVAALIGPTIEKPSDIGGLVYIAYGPGTDWKEDLRREFRKVGIPVL
jgi:hypothetical protein